MCTLHVKGLKIATHASLRAITFRQMDVFSEFVLYNTTTTDMDLNYYFLYVPEDKHHNSIGKYISKSEELVS